MEGFTRKQREIDRSAAEVIAAYPVIWSQMIDDWRQPSLENRAWLMYSANYLLRSANVRWTMDPLRLKHRLPDAPEMPVDDLKDLDFILLTHQHGDHLDLDLLQGLQDFPILWVVPTPILPIVQTRVKIMKDRLIVPEPKRTIDIRGIRITPLNGVHWEAQRDSQSLRGVPAMGFWLNSAGSAGCFPATPVLLMLVRCQTLVLLMEYSHMYG